MLNYAAVLFVCFVFKYRFAAVLARVINEALLPLFSPCFTEQKLWSWSSWRQFVSWEEATKLFSLRSTTLRRYGLHGDGKRGLRRWICHYISTVQFQTVTQPWRNAPQGRRATSRFLTPANGIAFLLSTDYRQQFSCIAQGDSLGIWRERLHVCQQDLADTPKPRAAERKMSDSLAWPRRVWMRYPGCRRKEWEVYDGMCANSSPIL